MQHARSLQATPGNPQQQHRIFIRARTEVVVPPPRSINPKRYRVTLERNLGQLLDPSEKDQWNTWVEGNTCHTHMNRLIVKGTDGIGFQIRAAVILLVPDVRKFELFERPPCDGYRNLLHIVRGWFPHAGKFPEKELEFIGKLILLSAHSELARDQDVLAYAWCATEALGWRVSTSLKKNLVKFLGGISPFIEQEDSALFMRVKQSL